MDSPGLFDTRTTRNAICSAILNAVACMHPGPHSLLYIIEIRRFTQEDEDVYTRLKALFDEKLETYTIVVFTGGDNLERSGASIEQMIEEGPETLRKILRACGNRYVVFNNMAQYKEPQVDILLQKVRTLVATNGGVPYTCPRYFQIGEGMEQEVNQRLVGVEERAIKRKRYVQELEDNLRQERETVEKLRKDLTRRETQQQQMDKEAIRKLHLETTNLRLKQQQQTRKLQELEAYQQRGKNEHDQICRKEAEIQDLLAEIRQERKKMQEEMAQRFYEMDRLKHGIAENKELSVRDTLKKFLCVTEDIVVDIALKNLGRRLFPSV